MATKTSTLSNRTYESLLGLILTGELPPGSPIDERALTERLGVSRTPFREAIADLAGDGLVDIRPYRGFSVHQPTPKEIDDLYQLRRTLEAFAIRLAVENISNADILRLTAVLDAGVAALEADDLETYGVHDAEFHGTIARLSGNEPLIETLERLALRIQDGRSIANRNVNFAQHAAAERDAILEALRARDADRAAALMDTHIAHVQRAVLEEMTLSADNTDTPATRRRPTERR
jgi:DNA-binding GntR family transcriptional regulator